MSNLIELQKNYVLNILDEIQTVHNIKFLVIDKTVETIFQYLFKDSRELLNHVTTVDRIDSPTRKGQSDVEVIYMVQESKFNMNCMDADFAGGINKYKSAYVRFIASPGDYLVKYFNDLRYLPQYLNDVREIKIGFIPKESQFFQTIDIDKPLQIFYNQNCHDLIEKNLKRTLESLLNLCIITGEYPIIRYSKATQSQLDVTPAAKLAEKLAFMFQQYLDAYAREHEDFPPPSNRPRAIMLITDRSLDPFSLFIHDFAYQPMVYDLSEHLDLKTGEYKYQAENELGEMEDKSSKLCDLLDPDWIELRHQHIVNANEYLGGKIKEMIARNPLLVDRSKIKNTSDLLSVVAHLKDFDEERRRMILHKTLIEECLMINHERSLADLSDLEQTLASFGIDMDGQKVKHITDQFLELLLNKKANKFDKIRYILIYSLYRGGIIEQDLIKLLNFTGISNEDEMFNRVINIFKNFSHLAFKLIKNNTGDKPFDKEWFHDSIVKDPTIFNSSRFIPATGSILSKVITNPLLLNEEFFPFVKDKPIELLNEDEIEIFSQTARVQSSTSLRNQRHKASWTKSGVTLPIKENRQRFFYYCIGGITFTEIKSAYDQSNLKDKDVFIGSDGVLTPLAAMASIEYLTKPRGFFKFNDDKKEDATVPDYLLKELNPVSQPISHIHYQSKNAPTRTQVSTAQNKPQPTTTTPDDNDSKKKKKNKFTRFLKRDKK
ncbi:Sec1p PWA37_003518 [Arxiozyma heterogenica]|uniref:Sec1p n=1 Tax=Arxiozyma heterogenica TaxID=278026 RepID=UPI002F055D1A